MNIRNQTTKCDNCGYSTQLTPSILKEEEFNNVGDNKITALYVECPICGERTLKQLDNNESSELKTTVVKLRLMQRRGKKLSDKQKRRLFKLSKELNNIRKTLNTLYWDEVYQLLNK